MIMLSYIYLIISNFQLIYNYRIKDNSLYYQDYNSRKTPIVCLEDSDCNFDNKRIIDELKLLKHVFCGKYPCTEKLVLNNNYRQQELEWSEYSYFENIYSFQSCYLNKCVYGDEFSSNTFCKHIYSESKCNKFCNGQYKFINLMDQSCCQCYVKKNKPKDKCYSYTWNLNNETYCLDTMENTKIKCLDNDDIKCNILCNNLFEVGIRGICKNNHCNCYRTLPKRKVCNNKDCEKLARIKSRSKGICISNECFISKIHESEYQPGYPCRDTSCNMFSICNYAKNKCEFLKKK